MLGDALSDAHNKGYLGGDGLLDTSSGEGRAAVVISSAVHRVRPHYPQVVLRNKDGGCGSPSLLHSLGDVGKNWQAKVCLACLLRVCPADNLGT